MKKILCLTLCILFIFLFSCAYKADYPETYTPEYCYNNYVRANPNLKLTFDTKIAKNPVVDSNGRKNYNGTGSFTYRGIENIPVEEYLWEYNNLFLGSVEHLVRNKNYSQDPIFDYNAVSAEIVWRGKENYESVAQIDVTTIKNFICEAIKSKNFVDISQRQALTKEYTPEKTFFNIEPKTDTLFLGIEIVFSEYENLFWRGSIQKDEADSGNYYVTCYIESGKSADSRADILYDAVYIALPKDISEIIFDVELD